MAAPSSTLSASSGEVIPSAAAAPVAAPPQRRRRKPGTPSPEAEVIALSPETLTATHRFVCEVCNEGFQRDQNLQLHKRKHNIPWQPMSRPEDTRKKVYVCPVPDCVYHNPLRALGDFTGIKKHFCRKHGERIFRCDKCNRMYAVQLDLKAHTKICGTRTQRCSSGTVFARFVTDRSLSDEGAPHTMIPSSVSSIAGNISSNTSSASASGLASAAEQASPMFGSLTSPLTGPSVGSGQLLVPQPTQEQVQVLKAEALSSLIATANSFKRGFHEAGTAGSLKSNYSGMSDYQVPGYTLPMPQLSATCLLQRASLMESSNYNRTSLMNKSFGSSSSGGMKMSNYGGGGGGGAGGPSSIYGSNGAFGGEAEVENVCGVYKGKSAAIDLGENQLEGEASYCDKLFTRDFLGLDNWKRSSGENDEVEMNSDSSEATISD